MGFVRRNRTRGCRVFGIIVTNHWAKPVADGCVHVLVYAWGEKVFCATTPQKKKGEVEMALEIHLLATSFGYKYIKKIFFFCVCALLYSLFVK